MAHWSLCTVPRERCALQRQSGSLHMAAPPWRATDSRTLHWNSHGRRDDQWPIGPSPQSPGKAVHSRGRVALLTWQPPLTCHGLADPPLEFARAPWSSMAHWCFSTVPREGCALQRRSGSPHMAAPPWRARDSRTPHWNSHQCRDHQWPIGLSPQSPGKAVHSRGRVALFTWQPPLTCHGLKDPPLDFARE